MTEGRERLATIVGDALNFDGAANWVQRVVDALYAASGGEDHIVNVKHAAWTVQHPLDERFSEGRHNLFDCPVTKHVASVEPSYEMPGEGRWMVRLTTTAEGNETLEWERVE